MIASNITANGGILTNVSLKDKNGNIAYDPETNQFYGNIVNGVDFDI